MMAVIRLGMAVIVAAAASLATALHSGRPTVPASPFGGSSPVHIAHVGRIDVDLEPPRLGNLQRVECSGADPGTACFVMASG